MLSRIRTFLALTLAGASTLAAQGPGPGGPGGPPMGRPTAEMLLAHTGDLELSDAQVVKLAAIARRGAARARTMRAAMDSARNRFTQPGDSIARRQFRDRMRTDIDRLQDQAQTDQRDALAVLTADQQAKAWNFRDGGRGRLAGRGGMRGMRDARPMAGQRRDLGSREPRPIGARPRARNPRPAPPIE